MVAFKIQVLENPIPLFRDYIRVKTLHLFPKEEKASENQTVQINSLFFQTMALHAIYIPPPLYKSNFPPSHVVEKMSPMENH